MTLHEAIEKLLRMEGKSLTTEQIANKLNANKWYQKKDKSLITAFQIHGRTRNYPDLFVRDGSTVGLKGLSIQKPEKPEKKSRIVIVKPTVKVSANLKSSFAPIIYPDTKIIILGSLPGDLSIQQGEYYAHPRNRFWKILAAITNSNVPENYQQKKNLLKTLKIGIWDVAHSADRKGSLDTSILNEIPNDLHTLLKNNKRIEIIAFNGQKARNMYDKHFSTIDGIKYLTLPSSSPANASISFDRICKIWEEALLS